MTALFVSPHLIDLIVLFTAIEGVALILWLRRRAARPGRLPVALTVGTMLLPGVFLMLATRAALAGAAWPWIPVALAAALFTHIFDLWVRWRR